MMETKHNLLAAALSYSRQGWAVLPVQPKGKAPLGKLVPRGFLNATTDSHILQQWWATESEANVGIRTGAISGLLVLDIDPRNGGISYWTVRDLVFRREIPFLKIGRRVLVDRLDLDAYLDRSKIHSGA